MGHFGKILRQFSSTVMMIFKLDFPNFPVFAIPDEQFFLLFRNHFFDYMIAGLMPFLGVF